MNRSPCHWLLVVASLAACHKGGSSDIGPRLTPLSGQSSRAVVLDTQGRGVVGAEVTVVGTPLQLWTGRNGRGDFLANPSGRLRVRVDATNGAAVSGDRLGGYVVAQTFGRDLPAVLHVPELPDSAGAGLLAGTQAGATTITTTGGATLTVAAGSSVGIPSGANSVALRCGEIPAWQLPGDLPTRTDGQALLWSRGVLVSPNDVTFAPGATLDVPDDLLLGTGAPSLYRLDPDSGEWSEVVTTTNASGGRLVATAAVAGAGLYAFATPVAATSVTLRVLDNEIVPVAVPDVLVCIDGRHATTDGNGRCRIDGLPLTDGAGNARSARIELFPGGGWQPTRRDLSFVLQAGLTDAGTLEMDTRPCANVRVQQVLRGDGDTLQTARIGSQDGAEALTTISDGNGQAVFEDVPGGYVGYQTGRLRDPQTVNYGQLTIPLPRDKRWFDTTQFLQRRSWFQGTRRSRATITDAIGGGSLRGGWMISGAIAEQGLVGQATDGGSFFVTRDFSGRATAVQPSDRDGLTVLHAYTIVRPDGDHLEFPMQRILRQPIGAFDRHGLLTGTLTGVDLTRVHELRATRRLRLEEWWDDVVDGMALRSSLPIDVDPAVTHGAFTVGVTAGGGNVVANELTVAGGRRRLRTFGVLQDLVPQEGRVQTADIALAFPATQTITLPAALDGVDPAIVASDLRVDLALERTDGLAIDVVRDLADNLTAAGTDLQLELPELTGGIANARWHALLRGTATSGADTLQHASLVTLPGVASTFRLPPFPTFTSLAAGATVAASGFTVQFALPAGALHGQLELRSTVGSDTKLWTVVFPPEATEFTFVRLPAGVSTPLVAGRTYTLTLTAFFADGGVASVPNSYRELSTFLQSVNALERGVTRVARRSISVTAN